MRWVDIVMRKSLFCFEALCLIYEPIHRIEHLIRISKDLVHKGRSDGRFLGLWLVSYDQNLSLVDCIWQLFCEFTEHWPHTPFYWFCPIYVFMKYEPRILCQCILHCCCSQMILTSSGRMFAQESNVKHWR